MRKGTGLCNGQQEGDYESGLGEHFSFGKKFRRAIFWQDEIMATGGFSEKNLPHQYYAMPKSLKTEDKLRQIRLF